MKNIIKLVKEFNNLRKVLKTSNMKNWKTTSAAAIATLVILLGVLKPDLFNPDMQEGIKSLWNEIIIVVGSIIALVNGFKARDPE
jgi:hypothetical protein